MSSVDDFIDRIFKEPLPEHRELETKDPDEIHKEFPLDCELFDWEYFGLEKYGRYALCKNTSIKRRLTFAEFYGTSNID